MKSTYMDVVAAVIWENTEQVSEQSTATGRKYLAQQRPLHYPMGGFWEFPGGKVDAGESFEEALKRELLEELQIVVQKFTFWKSLEHDYGTRKVRLHLYHVTAFTGKAQCVEGQNIRWIYPHEAQSLNFLEADKGLIGELEAGLAP